MFPLLVNNLETFEKLSRTLQGEQIMVVTLLKLKESFNNQSDKLRMSSTSQNSQGQTISIQNVDRKGPKLSGVETIAGY